MKTFRGFVFGLVAALAGAAGLALAAGVNFPGFQAITGTMVDVSTDSPTIAITGGQSAVAGGSNTGVYVNTATTAAGTLTFVGAAPGGRVCDFNDETTVTNKVTQGAATDGKTVVTVVGTVGAADKISWSCVAY